MTDNIARNIAIVGAGPASLYAAQKLSKEGHNVVIVNRDIKHGGLAEFGIYPNKYKMKSGLRRVFNKIMDHESVSYFGNVLVGADGSLTLEELRAMGFDAVVVAVGAQGTKWLGLPGEELPQVYHAKDLVYYYNGLPPFSEREFPVGDNVVVIGMGNVCLDIVHWLVCDEKVASVTAVARRGPAERAYTEKEMKIVSGALDVEQVRATIEQDRERYEAVGQDVEELVDALIQHRDEPLEVESPSRFGMRFLLSPVRIEATEDGQIASVVFEKTRLEDRGGERLACIGTGEYEEVGCDTVVFAIGDSIEPSIGLPLEPKWQSTFMTVPEVWSEYPDRERYMVWDPQTEAPISDTFVVGWARKASDGLVGKARADAVQGCDEILAYLAGDFGHDLGTPRDAEDLLSELRTTLRERSVEFVEWDDLLRLIEAEEEIARERGLPEFKFTTTTKMLDEIRGGEA